MKINEEKIKEILEKGAPEIIEKAHLEELLKSGKKLKIKFGIDPTAPDLHLGHAVSLRKLRQFQDLGHNIILIIGDFTAQIGDPSGKDTARIPLTSKAVKANLKKYLLQAGKIINIKKTKVLFNSKWLGKNIEILLELSRAGSIQQMMHREDFRARIAAGSDVTLLEAMYPLFQGYDSVVSGADVEIGGADQKLNLLSGRRLQRYFKKPEQDILMMPLLVGTDGVKKMSKSSGNYISIFEKPATMFSKIMSVPDGEIGNYFSLLTEHSASEKIDKPMEEKKDLAWQIVKMLHGDKEANKALEFFEKTFSKKEAPREMDVKKTVAGKNWVDFLTEEKFAVSRSDAKRLIDGGAVDFEGRRVTRSDEKIEKGGVAKIGKYKFVRIEV